MSFKKTYLIHCFLPACDYELKRKKFLRAFYHYQLEQKIYDYKSFQNLELKPFALISFCNVNRMSLKGQKKINNKITPNGLKKGSTNSKKLLLIFEDSNIPKEIKITKIAENAFNALVIFSMILKISS